MMFVPGVTRALRRLCVQRFRSWSFGRRLDHGIDGLWIGRSCLGDQGHRILNGDAYRLAVSSLLLLLYGLQNDLPRFGIDAIQPSIQSLVHNGFQPKNGFKVVVKGFGCGQGGEKHTWIVSIANLVQSAIDDTGGSLLLWQCVGPLVQGLHIDPIFDRSTIARLTHEMQPRRNGRIQLIQGTGIGQNAIAPLEPLVHGGRQGGSPRQRHLVLIVFSQDTGQGRSNRGEPTGGTIALTRPFLFGQFTFLVVGQNEPDILDGFFGQGGYQLRAPISIGIQFGQIVKIIKLTLALIATGQGWKFQFQLRLAVAQRTLQGRLGQFAKGSLNVQGFGHGLFKRRQALGQWRGTNVGRMPMLVVVVGSSYGVIGGPKVVVVVDHRDKAVHLLQSNPSHEKNDTLP